MGATPARWLDVDGSTFTNNVALNGSGGALDMDVTTNIQGSAGLSNGGDNGGIIGAHSEPLERLMLSMSNSSFTGNVANGTGPSDGGGACSLVLPAGSSGGEGLSSGGSSTNSSDGDVAIYSCNFTTNSAQGHGGALLFSLGCGAQANTTAMGLRLSTSRAVGNAAGRNGGALALVQRPAQQGQSEGSCRGSNGAAQLMLVDCWLDENEAAGSGGGMYVYGRLGVGVEGTQVWSNVAAGGPGGGVAVVGCSQLALSNSSANGNGAAAGGGGGVFAGGCGRVLLSQSELVGNRALAGGALHVTAGAAASAALGVLLQQQGSVNLPGTAGPGAALLPYKHTAVLVDQVRFSNNTALDEGQVSGEEGRGGAVFLSGAVAAAIVRGDFSGGNTARFGSSIASTQTCRPQLAAQPGGTVAPSHRRVGASFVTRMAYNMVCLLVVRTLESGNIGRVPLHIHRDVMKECAIRTVALCPAHRRCCRGPSRNAWTPPLRCWRLRAPCLGGSATLLRSWATHGSGCPRPSSRPRRRGTGR